MKEFKDLNLNHSSKIGKITRVKSRKREPRKTVGITLPLSLIEEARKRNLNISRICEQALRSVLEYLEAQEIDAPQKEAQPSFGEAFLQRKGSVPRAGFEPRTNGDIPRKSPFFRLFRYLSWFFRFWCLFGLFGYFF